MIGEYRELINKGSRKFTVIVGLPPKEVKRNAYRYLRKVMVRDGIKKVYLKLRQNEIAITILLSADAPEKLK